MTCPTVLLRKLLFTRTSPLCFYRAVVALDAFIEFLCNYKLQVPIDPKTDIQCSGSSNGALITKSRDQQFFETCSGLVVFWVPRLLVFRNLGPRWSGPSVVQSLVGHILILSPVDSRQTERPGLRRALYLFPDPRDSLPPTRPKSTCVGNERE